MIGALHDLGDLRRALDFGHPFGGRAEHRAIVHLLKRAATAHGPLDLADEQDHRRAVVLGDMDAVRGVGGAGAAGDEADAGPPGQPADDSRHDRRSRLLAADRHLDLGVVERVERGEIGFAGDAIDPLNPLRDQLVDEDLAAGAGFRGVGHGRLHRRRCLAGRGGEFNCASRIPKRCRVVTPAPASANGRFGVRPCCPAVRY